VRSFIHLLKNVTGLSKGLNGRRWIWTAHRCGVGITPVLSEDRVGARLSRLVGNLRGVTLVEIMAALVVFGILIVLSVPAFRRYMATQQVEGSVHRMAANLRLARQSAATERNNYKVRFDPATRRYSILDDDNNNGTADTGEMVLGPVNIPGELTVTNGPALPFSGDTLVFYPNGSTNSTGTITFENRRHYSRLVRVMRSTGAVAVR